MNLQFGTGKTGFVDYPEGTMNPKHEFSDPDLKELDRIWPLGRQLDIPDRGKVLVAGAYKGRYMDYLCSLYNPRLIVGFEPQPSAALEARKRLAKYTTTESFVFAEGLGVHDCLVTMEHWGGDGCKVGTLDPSRNVVFRGIDSVLFQYAPFDLFICNMEFYEYALLSYLVGSDQLGRMKSLAVQFHSDNQECRNLMDRHYGAPVYSDWPTWMMWRD